MTLIVCSLDILPETIAARRPSHVITLLEPSLMIEPAQGVAEENHLRLSVHDITRRARGMVAPDEALVNRLLAFARGWDQGAPMIVHCLAGVSRSTASALAIACDRNPDVPEVEIARTLRRVAPHAYPNSRIIALADAALDRRGRLVAAVEAMGVEDMGAYRVPFDLPAAYRAEAPNP